MKQELNCINKSKIFIDFDNSKCISRLNRFIPEGKRPYYDKIDLGWSSPLLNYVEYDSQSIFNNLTTEK